MIYNALYVFTDITLETEMEFGIKEITILKLKLLSGLVLATTPT